MTNTLIPYLAVARVSGEDAGEFLQSQLSADILALDVDDQTFAAYCTPKGQVLGLLRLARTRTGYLVAARDVLLPGILRRLQMYVLRSKVKLEAAPDVHVVGTNGPEYAFDTDGTASGDDAAWHAAELRAGIAWLDEAVSEKFIPQMLGYETIGAVNFQKGCYPGQEIVARARYLGKVKRKPLLAEIEPGPEPANGTKLRLLRGGDWTDAVLVDRAMSGARQVLFTVARTDPDSPVEAVEIDGQTYRCATT